jgi:hypothetical protein
MISNIPSRDLPTPLRELKRNLRQLQQVIVNFSSPVLGILEPFLAYKISKECKGKITVM